MGWAAEHGGQRIQAAHVVDPVRRHREEATRLQDAMDLRNASGWIGQVVEHMHGDDGIEAGVFEGQGGHIGLQAIDRCEWQGPASLDSFLHHARR